MFIEVTDGLMIEQSAITGVMTIPNGIRIYFSGQHVDIKVRDNAAAYEKISDMVLTRYEV